ncbi:MAG: enoyl-CoA hydratase/isomerase family protein [Alphaproteobacteria bacterium]
MAYETILYQTEKGRARITLNRPDKRNALSEQLLYELGAALWEADNDKAVHCVIIRGAGGAFSAGYDMTAGYGQDGGRPSRARARPIAIPATRSMTMSGDSNGPSGCAWPSSTCTSRSLPRCTAIVWPAGPMSPSCATW